MPMLIAAQIEIAIGDKGGQHLCGARMRKHCAKGLPHPLQLVWAPYPLLGFTLIDESAAKTWVDARATMSVFTVQQIAFNVRGDG